MGGAKEFLVSVSIALTADLPFSMFVPSFISGSLHSWSLNLCICERWVKVLVPIPGWLLFSLALAWTLLIRAFNGTPRNFTEPGEGLWPLQTFLRINLGYWRRGWARRMRQKVKTTNNSNGLSLLPACPVPSSCEENPIRVFEHDQLILAQNVTISSLGEGRICYGG